MLDDVTGKPLPAPISATQRERQRLEMITVINAQGRALDRVLRGLDELTAIRTSQGARLTALDTRLDALERAHVYAMTRTRWQRIWNLIRG